MSQQNSIITLNPGRDGDETDATEFLLYDAYGAPIYITSGPRTGTQESVKRERIVISGDDSRDNIVNPVLINGEYRVPTYDEHQRRALDRQTLQLEALIDKQPPTGQKPMVSSVPVAIASDQSPVQVRTLYGNRATYSASTNGTVGTGTAIATVTSIAYLFHPQSSETTARIGRIFIGWGGGAGNSNVNVQVAYITAENAVPGGTSRPIQTHDPIDPPSNLTFRSGAAAPTRITGDLFTGVAQASAQSAGVDFNIFEPTLNGKPIVLPARLGRGLEVRTVIGAVALTTALQVSVYMTWTEN